MSDKAARKKQYILDTARKVFSEKGFKDVTMKDIVEACEISRGGLYIYFESTEQILLELIKLDSSENDDVFSRSRKDATAGDILALFLKEQKKELLSKKDNLSVAIYEYLFTKKNGGDTLNIYKDRFSSAVNVLTHLIENGTENGELYCEDAEGAARNIMYVIEGLKIAANTVGVTEQDIDNELLFIMSGLLADEE
ncbi:MAG: TetR/AcrR family transcriptional regulator [Lachnospiraceae bacterium]|nr:TetR/AcrR family transcriptional regulator [Lachnospiraceae bacterium]MBO7600614.1 TetR/AcrR family transcriptional regulator [Lachnospiraceae bacterium]